MAFKRPFRIGDLIEIDGFKGKVTNMSLRETLIKTLDGKEVFNEETFSSEEPTDTLAPVDTPAEGQPIEFKENNGGI